MKVVGAYTYDTADPAHFNVRGDEIQRSDQWCDFVIFLYLLEICEVRY